MAYLMYVYCFVVSMVCLCIEKKKISEKSNGRIIEKWLKFLSSHSVYRNRSLNFTPAFFRRFKDLEPMLMRILWYFMFRNLYMNMIYHEAM